MKRPTKMLFLLLVFTFILQSASAQLDPHFSQYFASPLWLNPALTGVHLGEYRAGVHAKREWGSLSNGFTTAGAYFDTSPTKNLALGGMVLSQRAGDIDFSRLDALASGSYRIRLGRAGDQVISFGLQAGIISKGVDPSKMRFGNQYNPEIGFDPSLYGDANISSESYTALDVNTGIAYFDNATDKNINFFGGLGVAHLTRPKDRFAYSESRVPMRYAGHAGARVRLSYLVNLMPSLVYLKQGTDKAFSSGVQAEFMLNQTSDLVFGGNYRWGDSIAALLGMRINNLVIGMGYDLGTAQLNKAAGRNNNFELSISFLGKRSGAAGSFSYPWF